jgi:hypothetical protein
MMLTSESSYILLKLQAESFLVAERPEDAARTYEKIGMWKEAGDLRRKARQPQVTTQVHVNMNDLIDQLRRMGLSANFTCPACRSPNTITGEMPSEKMTKCQYCGAIIPSTDLVDAIARVIGYH